MGWIVWMPVSLRFKIFKSVHFYVFVFELKRTVRFIERTNVFFFLTKGLIFSLGIHVHSSAP